MKTTFIATYPWWFLLLCIIVAFAMSYLLYGNKKYLFNKNEHKGWRYGLATLRFVSTFLITFLLLSLLLKTKHTEEEKPIVILLQDNTASLKTSFAKNTKEQYEKQINTLQDEIKNKYEVVTYNFGAGITNNNKTDFTEQETDISATIDELFVKHGAQNIGAVILASDGIFNKGISPLYNKNIQSVPFYTIALGDTTIKKDALIKSVRYPEIVYLGDQFAINIQIEANHLQGQSTVLEVIAPDGKSIQNKPVAITTDHFVWQTDVVGDANKAGVLQYHIKLKTMQGEAILENNTETIYVEVLDGRQKILLLYDAPHPDIKAIGNVVAQNKNYQFTEADIKTYTGKYKEDDLIILYGLPSIEAASKFNILQEISNSGIPTLWVLSSNSYLSQFNTLQKIVQINNTTQNGNDVYPVFQSSFSKFVLSPQTIQTLSALPPLLSPFGKYQQAATADVLCKQQIGNVKTENPLIVLSEINGKKTGIICAEGLWRWRLNEFAQTKKFDATDEIINKTIQYLTIKGDKRRFRIHATKNIYNANEAVQLDAELYNESYELVNDVDATCNIKDDKGKEYKYTFDKTVNAYTLNAGILPVGNYTVNAKADYKGKTNNASCNFSIRPILIELLNTQANHLLLNSIAQQSGGKMYYPSNMQQIATDLEKNPSMKSILYNTFTTQPLIDFKILFFIILLLLSLEWIIRKYNGII